MFCVDPRIRLCDSKSDGPDLFSIGLKMKHAPIAFLLILFVGLGEMAVSEAGDLTAVIGLIPPHAQIGEDGHPRGGFVDVVKAIDKVYQDGQITIKILPIARAIRNVVNGQADFFIPYIPNPHVPSNTLPFSFAAEPVVDVSFVLYSHADKPVPPIGDLEKFNIETLRGAALHFPFNIAEIDSFKQGILRVVMGRSDGFIVEQDAGDKFIRDNKIKPIRRTLYAKWHSSILIPKGPKGEKIDRIISDALQQLKKSGTLTPITETIHRPYTDWQPYTMDW